MIRLRFNLCASGLECGVDDLYDLDLSAARKRWYGHHGYVKFNSRAEFRYI